MIARRSFYLLSCAIVLAGYGLVVQPAERSIREVQIHSQELYDEANANELKIRRSAELELAARRVRSDIASLKGRPDSAIASALQLLNLEARRFNVNVRSVNPDANAAVASPSVDLVQAFAWNVSLRGRFRNIVAILADLSKHDVLLEVQDASLAATAQASAPAPSGSSPVLEVTVRTIVYLPAAAGLISEVDNAPRAAR